MLLALGGGVIGDIVGLAASLVLRGIDFVQVPTTLLAQVDSSVGGKTGINTRHGKNLVGAFYQPRLVLADLDTLATLPARELLAGYAEIVKYGLIDDPAFFAWCEANAAGLVGGDVARRLTAVSYAVRSKARTVAEDERESGKRGLLNLGHTFGHALEAASGYELPHGKAVALGLQAALRLSGRDTAPVDEALAPQPVRVDRERAWEALLRDKKGRLRIVLLADEGAHEAELPEADVRAALDELIAE